jgi:hypothetical protein
MFAVQGSDRIITGSAFATYCSPGIFTKHEVAKIELGFEASLYKCRLKNIEKLALRRTTPNSVQITELIELELAMVSKMESENDLHT